MNHVNSLVLCTLLVLSGCAMTQKPAVVSDSGAGTVAAPVASVNHDTPVPAPRSSVLPAVHGAQIPVVEGISLDKLPTIAKIRQKTPAGLKQYVGQTLHGQGKFVKTAKGNPNAMVADVRVGGVGEVSIWCRNVLGVATATAGKMTGFDGVFTGEVYTSEDFSHDVYLKDCRFHD